MRVCECSPARLKQSPAQIIRLEVLCLIILYFRLMGARQLQVKLQHRCLRASAETFLKNGWLIIGESTEPECCRIEHTCPQPKKNKLLSFRSLFSTFIFVVKKKKVREKKLYFFSFLTVVADLLFRHFLLLYLFLLFCLFINQAIQISHLFIEKVWGEKQVVKQLFHLKWKKKRRIFYAVLLGCPKSYFLIKHL